MPDDRTRENRLRRRVQGQGLQLQKSRRRDRGSVEYGKFRIVNPANDSVVTGDAPYRFSMTLDEVENWLTG